MLGTESRRTQCARPAWHGGPRIINTQPSHKEATVLIKGRRGCPSVCGRRNLTPAHSRAGEGKKRKTPWTRPSGPGAGKVRPGTKKAHFKRNDNQLIRS
ncbi:hypothetical protein SRHO_G00234780 [Serrasalmus rhombeus]